MTAPVAGSGSWPAWMARVSNSTDESLGAGHTLRSDHLGEPGERTVEDVVEPRPDAALAVEREHAQHALAPVVLQVDPPDEHLAAEERKHVVTVDALEPRAIPEQVVERGEQLAARNRVLVRLARGGQEDRRLPVLDLEAAEPP